VTWREEVHRRDRRGRFADVAAAGNVAVSRRAPLAGAIDVTGGGWRYRDRRGMARDLIAEWTRLAGRRLDPEERAELLQQLLPPGGHRADLSKGEISIFARTPKIRREHLEHTARVVDRLQARWPIAGPVYINLDRHESLQDPQSSAETVRGRGHIRLSERVFTQPQDASTEHLMPSRLHADRASYVLVHEWAHARDDEPPDSSRKWQMYIEHAVPGLSLYALHSPAEAKAEAFAEWVLTGGRTSNEHVRSYARTYRWEAP
jgi:hypothetical protein